MHDGEIFFWIKFHDLNGDSSSALDEMNFHELANIFSEIKREKFCGQF